MLVRGVLLAMCCSAFATAAFADQVLYSVSVDTHTISGLTGTVDFQFDPATPLSQFAFSEILNFTGGSLVPPSTITGDVGGALPGIVVLNNDTPTNEYQEGFVFGPNILFDLLIAGPALTNPGLFLGGSTFSFSVLNSTGVPLLTTSSSGALFAVDVNAGGTTTLNIYSPAVTITPEPASLFTLLTAVAVIGLVSVWSKRNSRSRLS